LKNEIKNDNIYKEGTVICAKADPALKLIITKYRQRIYYCMLLDHPDQSNFAHFEKELMLPHDHDQELQFDRIEETIDLERNYVKAIASAPETGKN
jgi:hypothetical protein